MYKQTHQTVTRGRGSVMLAVVVMLVMLALIGTAYIQLARYDRIASVAGVQTNIGVVANATTTYIGEVLKADLLNDTTDAYFDPAENKDEPYDYPWTNNTFSFDVVDQDGTVFSSEQATGGALDDTWLASSEPIYDHSDYTAGTPVWPHITNLNGIFLRLPHNLAGKPNRPDELPANNLIAGYQWRRDTDVPIKGGTTTNYLDAGNADSDYQDVGADADGDGILDSKWTWAPIRQISGVSYVMAVRIVDNSSKLNINTALSQVSGSNTYDPYTNAPAWTNPSELDLGNFYFSYSPSPKPPLQSHLNFLINGTLSGSDTIVPLATRDSFWTNGPYLYGNYNAISATSYMHYTISDEIFLGYRNGLNNTDLSSTLASHFSNWLRTSTNENLYTDGGYSDIQDFYQNDPRHQMTVTSGSSIYALNPKAATGFRTKKDINNLASSNVLTALSTLISEVYSTGTTPSVPQTIGTLGISSFSNQAAVCIADYHDADNFLTPFDEADLSNTVYGMEALPAITEVYVQRPYVIAGTTNTGVNMWDVDVQAASNSQLPGFAIEIRNPFNYAISLENVYLYIKASQVRNGASVDTDLATLIFNATGTAKTTLDQGETIIFYNNSVGGASTNDDITNQIDAAVPAANRIALSSENWPWATGVDEEEITVELRATLGTITPQIANWSYQSISTYCWNETETAKTWNAVNTSTDLSTAPYPNIYRQYTVYGNGNGINAICIQDSTFTSVANSPLSTPTLYKSLATVTQLGIEDKTPATVPGPANLLNPAQNQILIANEDKIYFIGELAQICMVGPNASQTFAQAWNNATTCDNHRLDIATTAPQTGAIDSMAIPHAYLLMDQLVTTSPLNDGIDNDGDGSIDNNTELYIPGTINLNTASQMLLEQIIPIPEPTVRAGVVQSIIDYRNAVNDYDTTTYPGSRLGRTNHGIAHLGELLGMSKGTYGTNYFSSTDTGDSKQLNGVTIDYTPSSQAGLDGIQDDREESLIVSKWLMNTCSVRSDIFTAYIYILGFNSSDFSLGPIESKQYFVIYDRSNIANGDSNPKILGIYEYD